MWPGMCYSSRKRAKSILVLFLSLPNRLQVQEAGYSEHRRGMHQAPGSQDQFVTPAWTSVLHMCRHACRTTRACTQLKEHTQAGWGEEWCCRYPEEVLCSLGAMWVLECGWVGCCVGLCCMGIGSDPDMQRAEVMQVLPRKFQVTDRGPGRW